MTEDAQDLVLRVGNQTVNRARDFFGASLGRLKDRLRDDRSQLEDLAERLRQEEARTRIWELVDSYAAIEGSIEEAAPHAHYTEGQDTVEQAVRGVRDTVAGTVGQAASVAGQVRQVAENLPGGRLLSRTADESGRTVQRVVDETGDIIETNLDESGELVDKNPMGSLTDLPAEEESTTEEGHILRTVRDESGVLVRLELDPDGSVLGLETLPDRRAR
jgi:hypothetical protein